MKYGGSVIHRRVDGYGPIEVVDAHGIRSLHFGSPARQSVMDLAAPDRVELPYLRSMLASLLFHSSPRRILVMGLGGGTLTRFFMRHFDEARLDVVELRPAVVEVAQQFFHLQWSPLHHLHLMDAADYLSDVWPAQADPFDLAMVDVFDGEGPSALMEDPLFLHRLVSVLSPRGVMAINLWSGEDYPWRRVQAEILQVASGPLGVLPVLGRGNRICFLFGEAFQRPHPRELSGRARTLDQQFGMEFTRFTDRWEWIRG